jgi:4-amino-4-deoxy-L-arabinose transferase-like glycosyltransferase
MRAVFEAPEARKATLSVEPERPRAARRTAWLAAWPIALILIAAALMRLNHVDQPLTDVFSWRQSSTAMMAENFYRRNWNILYPEVSWNGPGPTYQGREFQTVSYLTALLYLVVGQQEWVGRVVAITFGTWGVFALYLLARRVWDEPRALASAAILAVMPGAVFVDRSFLPDPAMVALATTTLWLWVAYLQTGRRRYLVLTASIGMWAFASKLPALLIGLPGVYAAVAILGVRQLVRPRRLLTFGVLATVVLVPVALYYLWVRELARLYPPYHFAGSGNWVWVDGPLAWWERGYYLDSITDNLRYWLWTVPIIGLVAVGLLLPPTRPEVDDPDDRPRAPWLFHWWLAGCAFYVLIGARELSENVWNLHIFNPPAAALAGQALILIGALGSREVGRPASLARMAVVMAVVLVTSLGTLPTLYKPQHAQDSYELGLALREVSAPGDLVVTMASDLGDPVAIYYSRRRGWIFPRADPGRWWNRLPADDSESIEQFEELRASGARWLGFVRHFNKETWGGHEQLLAHFRETCEYVADGPGWVIYRIRSPEERSAIGSP